VLNNPVNRIDPSGHCFGVLGGIDTLICAGVVVFVAGTIAAVASSPNSGFNWNDYNWSDWSLPGHLAEAHDSEPAASEPISGNVKRLPDEQLNPPASRGKTPTFKQDDTPVEIHHDGQEPTGPFEEMHWKDHRGQGNDTKNHPNKGDRSKIDRTQFNRDKKKYWENEWDRGRWNPDKDGPQ
jgi:hypothetical protein